MVPAMAADDERRLRELYAARPAEVPRLAAELADPEIEFVTRDGRFSGRDEFVSTVEGFMQATDRRFVAEFEVQDLIEAGDGVVIALLEVRRRSRDSEADYLTAWPANVWRFRDGRAVFFEGYQDRAKALSDYGVER